jgi:hypothetical protein
MSLATISTAPEAADPSAPGFKRYWRSWLERTAGQQANRSGGCQARFVKLFSAQVDDAVGGASEEAASAVRRLAGEWGYRARHEIEYEERWGREQKSRLNGLSIPSSCASRWECRSSRRFYCFDGGWATSRPRW